MLVEILDGSGQATVRIANGGSWLADEIPIVEYLVAYIFKTRCYPHYIFEDIDGNLDILEALKWSVGLDSGKRGFLLSTKTVADNYVFDVTLRLL